MRSLEAFVLDGSVALVALAILACECLLLALLRRRSDVVALLANALSGMSLIMALRAALLGPEPVAVAFWLGIGFLAHLADLAQRLRRRTSTTAHRADAATEPRPRPATRSPP